MHCSSNRGFSFSSFLPNEAGFLFIDADICDKVYKRNVHKAIICSVVVSTPPAMLSWSLMKVLFWEACLIWQGIRTGEISNISTGITLRCIIIHCCICKQNKWNHSPKSTGCMSTLIPIPIRDFIVRPLQQGQLGETICKQNGYFIYYSVIMLE